MKLPVALLTLGLALLALGFAQKDNPEFAAPLQQRLDGELSKLRSTGHTAELLVTTGGATELHEKARARASETGNTVIAVSKEWADYVPSGKDLEFAEPRVWSGVAQSVAWPYLRHDDIGGAATALVRAYSANLIERGLYPAQPPLPPIFLPDVTPSDTRSIDVHTMGFGIVLLIVALGLFLERHRTRAAAAQRAPQS